MNKRLTIVISGATGLLGKALSTYFEKRGHTVKRLVRRQPKGYSPQEIYWNPETGHIETYALENADVVINLSGQNIATRWTRAHKKVIRDSRVKSSKVLSEAIAKLKKPPFLFLSASATGFYGNRSDEELNEDSKPGLGFAASLCRDWESATISAEHAGTKVIHMRFGTILDTHGGILKRILPAFRMGFGNIAGTGEQFCSWITLVDLTRAIEHIIEHPELDGPINITSPQPVSQKNLMTTIAKALHRPCAIFVPPWLIQLLFGQMGEELLLYSCRAIPKKLLENGFQFEHGDIETAVQSLFPLSKP